MKTIDELYKYVEDENITYIKADLKDAYGYCSEENKLIILDNKINNIVLEKCTLAEECGHYFAGINPTIPVSNDYFTKIQRSKNEFKAVKWAISKLIPINTFKSLIKPDTFKYEVAEQLEVTEDFIEKACLIYQDDLIYKED